nr:hypothetical protein CFP56_71958 [Quercus suber]
MLARASGHHGSSIMRKTQVLVEGNTSRSTTCARRSRSGSELCWGSSDVDRRVVNRDEAMLHVPFGTMTCRKGLAFPMNLGCKEKYHDQTRWKVKTVDHTIDQRANKQRSRQNNKWV